MALVVAGAVEETGRSRKQLDDSGESMSISWMRIEGVGFWLLFSLCFLAVAAWATLRLNRAFISAAPRHWSRYGGLLLISTVTTTLLYRASPVISGNISPSRVTAQISAS
jgi:hypothetical protein